MPKLFLIYIPYLFAIIKCLEEPNLNNVEININYLYSRIIGKKGTIALGCDTYETPIEMIDITRNIIFQTNITNKNNISFPVNCGL